jgi:hypothetical protein
MIENSSHMEFGSIFSLKIGLKDKNKCSFMLDASSSGTKLSLLFHSKNLDKFVFCVCV